VPHPPTADLEALLRALGVDFILVGGAAAVIHGAPVSTQDLDIVPDQSDENVARLLAVLDQLGARFRPDQDRYRPSQRSARRTDSRSAA
jgi:hypothetical protein